MDFIQELVADHFVLRDLLRKLRSDAVGLRTKQEAIRQLGTWLRGHAAGEERTMNEFGKKRRCLRTLACEDGEEHAILEHLQSKLLRTQNPYLWTARRRLLCELLEQHLNEEEEEYFPLLRRELSAEDSERLALRYRSLTREMEPLRAQALGSILDWIPGRSEAASSESVLL